MKRRSFFTSLFTGSAVVAVATNPAKPALVRGMAMRLQPATCKVGQMDSITSEQFCEFLDKNSSAVADAVAKHLQSGSSKLGQFIGY